MGSLFFIPTFHLVPVENVVYEQIPEKLATPAGWAVLTERELHIVVAQLRSD